MTRNSGLSDQECFSYGNSIPEVQFVPNPSTRSNHRLLTPSFTSLDQVETTQENANHDYEDPSRLAQQVLTNNARRPRKKTNDLYEPMSMPLKTLNNVKDRVRTISRSSDEDSATGYTYHGREPFCHRVILYIVLFLSVAAVTLVILMIFGIVGPKCHCGNKQQTSDDNSPGKATQQFSHSIDPMKKTIEELQKNISRLESLLNTTSPDRNIPVVNGSISLVELQRQFDQKLNDTKDQLLAADGRIKGEVTAVNITLINKIQGISSVEGKQGPPGFNGSHGDQGPSGPPGTPGVQGPPGQGNFSQCQHLVEFKKNHAQSTISIDVNKVQPDGYIILGASCSTVGTIEYNLEINVPSGSGNPNFVCRCKGKSTLFPPLNNEYYCYLHYVLCPKIT